MATLCEEELQYGLWDSYDDSRGRAMLCESDVRRLFPDVGTDRIIVRLSDRPVNQQSTQIRLRYIRGRFSCRWNWTEDETRRETRELEWRPNSILNRLFPDRTVGFRVSLWLTVWNVVTTK
jgi:hypothetical protein